MPSTLKSISKWWWVVLFLIMDNSCNCRSLRRQISRVQIGHDKDWNVAIRESWLAFANKPSKKCWEHNPLHSGLESRARERRWRPIKEEFVHMVDWKGRYLERTVGREVAGPEESIFSYRTCSRAEDEISASGRCRNRCGVRAGLQAEALALYLRGEGIWDNDRARMMGGVAGACTGVWEEQR